ncbi:MAG: SLAP domain-containing protein [Clostridium sp.]
MKFFSKASSKKSEVERFKNKYLEEKAKVKQKVDMNLSLRPHEEIKTSKVVRDVYKEEIEGLSEIEEGDLNISTSYVFETDEGYEANVFLRNATKISVNLENPCFIVIDENDKIILQKVFNGEELGNIPPFSARPWKIHFDKIYMPKTVDIAKCKVTFKFPKPFAEKGEVSVGFRKFEEVSEDKIIDIIDYNNRLPLLKENEVNFNLASFEICDGFLNFNIVIRNSTENTLVDPDTLKPLVEEMPVSVYKNDEKVYSEVVRVSAIVGPLQAKYVSLSTAYRTDSLDGIVIKLNEI